jgi:hypothetical protein
MTPRTTLLEGARLLIVLAAAFALFRPDKLFVDQVVDEELDAGVAAALDEPDAPDESAPPTTAGPVVLARGAWTSLNHTTTGTVGLVEDAGTTTLVLDELVTDNGPDLFVYLSPATVGDGADYLAGAHKVGALKGNIGTQSYELAPGLDTSGFRSVVIWCDRFASGFGAAMLSV